MLEMHVATLEDLDEIISVAQEAYLPYLQFLSRKPRVLRMTKEKWAVLIKKQKVYTYKENDRIIATATFKVVSPTEADVSRIAVLPSYQGKGIGSRILIWAESQARIKKKTKLLLATYSKNERLYHYYLKRGYEIYKRFTHKNEEIVCFQKMLT